MTGEALERAGFTAWRTAEELRALRLRFPAEEGDRLARLLRSLEDDARGLAGEVAMRLREAGAPAGTVEP